MNNQDISLIREHFNLKTENPINTDPGRPILEASVADIKVKDLNAVYPLIRALNSEKLTRNNTYYPRETLIGKKNKLQPTGYASYVIPHPKPVITNHALQDGFFTQADKPMGRILYATYKAEKDSKKVIAAPKGMPGFLSGDGCMSFVACISDQEAVPKVLGGAYHTVSVGSRVGKIIESISGADLVALSRAGKELPPYNKGDFVEIDGQKRLCYWSMYDMMGLEVSYVNVPSDTEAFNEDPDIGVDGLKLLLGEKKVGSKEFAFYDALTLEKLFDLSEEEHSAFAPNLELIDSVKIPEYFFLNIPDKSYATESYKTPEEEDTKVVTPIEFAAKQLVNFEGHAGQILKVNENDVLVRLVLTESYKLTPEMRKVDKKKLTLCETQETQDNVNAKLKSFFIENFKPGASFKEKSLYAEPLLSLSEKKEWSEGDYSWAKVFKKVYDTCSQPETMRNWGVDKSSPIESETIDKMVTIITKELKNGKTN